MSGQAVLRDHTLYLATYEGATDGSPAGPTVRYREIDLGVATR